MELRGELVAAGLLEPVDHRLLHVHGVALHVYESLAQGPRVELLKDILVIQILEDGDAAGKLVINLGLRYSFTGLFQQ